MPQIIITPGDTLSSIADYIDSTVTELMRLNPQIKNANVIAVNSIINLPDTVAGRQFAAGRYTALKAKMDLNTNGQWGAWPAPTVPNDFPMPPKVPTTGPTQIYIPGGGATSMLSNPWILGAIGVVFIALLMGNKK